MKRFLRRLFGLYIYKAPRFNQSLVISAIGKEACIYWRDWAMGLTHPWLVDFIRDCCWRHWAVLARRMRSDQYNDKFHLSARHQFRLRPGYTLCLGAGEVTMMDKQELTNQYNEPPMSKHQTIEVYTAANGERSWRKRATNGRLLSGPVETFKSRAALTKNLNLNFGLNLTPDQVPFDEKPFDPNFPNNFITLTAPMTVELRGPTAPRRPRSHNQHSRKATAATLK